MLTLTFGHTAGKPGVQIGPLPAFHIEGELIKEAHGGKVLARHTEHHWEVDGEKFFRLDVSGPVRVHFEREGDPPKAFGPFSHYSMADGIAYVDRQFFASLSEQSGLWHCLELSEDSQGFRVLSAATS